MKNLRIGFVSTRLAGTDGVSLETAKWAQILSREGHECYYLAGELDTPAERSMPSERFHFTHPEIRDVYKGCFGCGTRSAITTSRIAALKLELKEDLRAFVQKFDLDLLIPENALTIPLNLPLGLALTEYIMETGFPAIAHHHDFFWERKRFLRNACWDYLNMSFPPHAPFVQHAVINSSQDNQLSVRTGISAVVIPNVMDYSNPPPAADDYADDLREALGIGSREKLILQPTRVVQRKGIEHSIELVYRLKMPAKLVISHSYGDEGDEYARRVRDYSKLLGVEPVFCSSIVGAERGRRADGSKIYTLADLYRQADLVTYPSLLEGFGNAFLEAIYYRRPLVVNDYAVFNSDIDPKGFQTIKMTDYVTAETVQKARSVLEDPEIGRKMADTNYELARRFFSYEVAAEKLRSLLVHIFGF